MKNFRILVIILRFIIKKPPIYKWISGYGSVINFLCYTKIYGKAEKMTSDSRLPKAVDDHSSYNSELKISNLIL